jgi:hypothetical protein
VKPLLTVEHGTAADVERAADAFARFYLMEFYHEILGAFIKQRRRIYLMAAFGAGLLALSGLVPAMINRASIFAYILMVMSLILLGVVIFSALRIFQAPEYCKQHLTTFFETQIAVSKSPERVVSESRFYKDFLEVVSGAASTKKCKKRHYDEISRVYETEEIYYFQGVGWIHKERLHEDQDKLLRAIISDSFAANRFVWVDVLLDNMPLI